MLTISTRKAEQQAENRQINKTLSRAWTCRSWLVQYCCIAVNNASAWFQRSNGQSLGFEWRHRSSLGTCATPNNKEELAGCASERRIGPDFTVRTRGSDILGNGACIFSLRRSRVCTVILCFQHHVLCLSLVMTTSKYTE